ncbi:putative GPI-anchored protein pfl2 isoform X2 [Pecten maximus]|uniref:putative GPI-anchored protein pfl2 isoform X2 n=1 Tax=Pecten maximus TaxID=6579 RepID=UPI0014581CA9|nr:putative GPI-anchored protein pfl2 isoform X2 [Pecten maximus]
MVRQGRSHTTGNVASGIHSGIATHGSTGGSHTTGNGGSILKIMTASSSTTSSTGSNPKSSSSLLLGSSRNSNAASIQGRGRSSLSSSSRSSSKSSSSRKRSKSASSNSSSRRSSRKSSKSSKSSSKANNSSERSSSSSNRRRQLKRQLINKMKAQRSSKQADYILLFNEGKRKRVSLTDLEDKLRPLVTSKNEYQTEAEIQVAIDDIVKKLREESHKRMQNQDSDSFFVGGRYIEFDHPARTGMSVAPANQASSGEPTSQVSVSNFAPSQTLRDALATLVNHRDSNIAASESQPVSGTEPAGKGQFLDSFFTMGQGQSGQSGTEKVSQTAGDMSATQAFRIAAVSSLLGQAAPTSDALSSPAKPAGSGSTTITTVTSSTGTQTGAPASTTRGSQTSTKSVSMTSHTSSSAGSLNSGSANNVYDGQETGHTNTAQSANKVDSTSTSHAATGSMGGQEQMSSFQTNVVSSTSQQASVNREYTSQGATGATGSVKPDTNQQASNLIDLIIASEKGHPETIVENSQNLAVSGSHGSHGLTNTDMMASAFAEQATSQNARNDMLASAIADIISSNNADPSASAQLTSNGQAGYTNSMPSVHADLAVVAPQDTRPTGNGEANTNSQSSSVVSMYSNSESSGSVQGMGGAGMNTMDTQMDNQNTAEFGTHLDITGMGALAMEQPSNMQDFNLAVSSAYGQAPQGSPTPVV